MVEALKTSIRGILTEDWFNRLEPFFNSEVFTDIMLRIKADKASGLKVYPDTRDVFKSLNLCSFDNLKVILSAQDPYHQRLGVNGCVADGLAFSCSYSKKPQPSLQKIEAEIFATTGSRRINENEYDLSYLALQGVFLINSSLTVIEGRANSHQYLWNQFINYLFNDVIYILNQIL